ncbi:MAG: glycosyltransferase family 4 protein [Candidatus Omnitrophica bacterium]|nr:glycosyltransferase family 4 protein [Candidatus Omnitrophota bacterium]
MKVLFLTQTAINGPASRYRVYQFLDYLAAQGMECCVSPAIPERCYAALYGNSSLWNKLRRIIMILWRRMFDLFRVKKFDIIFIQREILPQCFPVFEILMSLAHPRIVFDFDDAIFLLPPQRSGWLYGLRYPRAVEIIIRRSNRIIAGNRYLAQYARKYNPDVCVIPTSIDTVRWNAAAPGSAEKKLTVIGWIGSPHTLFYLDSLRPVLARLSRSFSIRFHLIGAGNVSIPGVDTVCIPWASDSEVEEVKKFDIGIAPLYDDAWGRGKCGLKALQYMSCAIPVVCSDAGVYKEFIVDGNNGFLAGSPETWEEKLALLIADKSRRTRMGLAGRETVVKGYSLESSVRQLAILLTDMFSTGRK